MDIESQCCRVTRFSDCDWSEQNWTDRYTSLSQMLAVFVINFVDVVLATMWRVVLRFRGATVPQLSRTVMLADWKKARYQQKHVHAQFQHLLKTASQHFRITRNHTVVITVLFRYLQKTHDCRLYYWPMFVTCKIN